MDPIPRSTAGSRRILATSLSPETFAQFGQVIQNPATHGGIPREVQSVVANQGSATKWLDVANMTNHYELGASRKAAKVVMNMFVCKPRTLVERYGDKVFPVEILERHPYTPQTFVPVGLGKEDEGTWYLVIVAPTLPNRSWSAGKDGSRTPPYPTPALQRKRSLRERLLGARPNPFTNDYLPKTTPEPTYTAEGPKPKGPGPPDLDKIQAFVARGDQAVTYGPGTWHAPMVVLGEKPVDFVVVQYANGVALEDCQETAVGASDGGEGIAIDLSGVTASTTAPKAKL